MKALAPFRRLLVILSARRPRWPRAEGRSGVIALLAALLLASAPPAGQAQGAATLTILHSFADGDGNPNTALVQGKDGNFYGTTARGGGSAAGTIFRCTPTGALTTLYSFSGSDGNEPLGLVGGDDGNFYGATHLGGSDSDSGHGIVFQVDPSGALTILHRFSGGDDGAFSLAGLVQGADGNFYGTTTGGGTNGYGTVFQITPAGGLATLHNFTGQNDAFPYGALVQGSDGAFYGTTNGDANGIGDGINNHGTVFQLDVAGTFTTLHIFSGSDGESPRGALVEGADGNFYGTTVAGGSGGADASDGTVFRISPAGGFTSLHSFMLSDGDNPNGALVKGADGNFYGTTYQGGGKQVGTVFRMTPAGGLTTIYQFGQDANNPAAQPGAGLLLASDGAFYGTTVGGGTHDDGTTFKLALGASTAHAAFFTGESVLGNGVYYLAFPGGNYFGYYSYLADPNYLYHFDLGYEYVFDANDGNSGVYFYDFASSDFFYTSPTFPFPYLYDFNLGSTVYYYPNLNNPGHYNTNGLRYFYNFATGKIITH